MKKTTTLMLGLLAVTFGGALNVQPAAAKTKVKEPTEKKAFTTQERATIKGYRQQLKGISNSTKGMYAQKPSLKKSFKPGKLSQKYINATVKSVNFYRQMYGLNTIKANPQWNEDAQYGAATMAAADEGLAHELTGIKRPGYVSKTAWNRGVDATGYSNIGEGVVKPYDNVLNYLVDSGQSDYVPGHREWLLGNTIEIGVGQAGIYNDLKVFEGGAKCRAFDPKDGLAKEVAYPKAGVFPINAVEGGVWSLSYSIGTGEKASKPVVKVTDNTTHKKIKVTHVTNYNDETGYGWFKTSISYQPKLSKVKVNHAYTVKISGLGNHADVNYQTKLFKLSK